MWPAISELAKSVREGRQSAVELVQRCLETADKHSSLNALLAKNKNALAQAEAIDRQAKKGLARGLLAGVPYLAKDNYLTKNIETTAASRILKGFIPPFNATVIEKLERAGAILVAKTNMDAFAHGSSNENSDYGSVRHPLDKDRVPGGSSGGSASAVRAGIAPFALGTDTGGSIRQPASFCGVVGYKPSYGLVSRYGVVAMASSTDVMGPITRNVADAAEVLQVIAGRDPLDSTSLDRPKKSFSDLEASLRGSRVGIVNQFLDEGIDEDVKRQFQLVVTMLRESGALISELSLPAAKEALSIYYVIVPAEVSSNLGRYDGVRYGPRASANDLESMYIKTRSEGFNAENRRRIIIGTYVLSSGYYDAYYRKAQQARTILIEEFVQAFKEVDFLIGPTTPTTAFKLGEKSQDPVAMYMSDVLTVAPNLTGSPAISIPIGADQKNLPVGLQIIAANGQDHKLLAFAHQLEEHYQNG